MKKKYKYKKQKNKQTPSIRKSSLVLQVDENMKIGL